MGQAPKKVERPDPPRSERFQVESEDIIPLDRDERMVIPTFDEVGEDSGDIAEE